MFVFLKSGRHAKWEAKHTRAAAAATCEELAVSSDETPVVAKVALLGTGKEGSVELHVQQNYKIKDNLGQDSVCKLVVFAR